MTSTLFSTLFDMIETKHYLSLAVAQTQEMFITSIVISCPGFCFIGTMFFSMKRDIMLQNTSSESSITVIKAQIDGLLRLIIHFDQQNFFDLQKKKLHTQHVFH